MKLPENPRVTANVFSKLLFCWAIPLFRVGFRRDLQIEDISRLLDSDFSQKLGDKLEKNWLKELQRCKEKDAKPSLLKVLIRTFISQYILDGICVFVQYVGCKTFQPLLLAMLLGQLNENGTWKNQTIAACLAGGIVLFSLINVFLNHHTMLHQQQLGMRVRIACCSLLYRKILRLNAKSFGKITVGQVINIMSNDVNRFDSVLKFLHLIWVAPIQVIVSLILYSENISPLTFIGILFIVILIIPSQTIISRLLGKLRLKVAKRTDERVKKMDETICGIQAIKMYAWEKPFEKAIKFARNKEMKFLKYASYLRGINASFILFTERVAVYATLIAHVVLGYQINASAVYPLFQFYYMLQIIMAFIYPHAVSSMMETKVSIQRIQEFLLLDEMEPQQIHSNGNQNKYKPFTKGKGSFSKSISIKVPDQGIINECFESDDALINNVVKIPRPAIDEHSIIEVRDVTVSWPTSNMNNEATLTNISMNFRRGKLYAIIGPVGSGKSTLLQLMLKELSPIKGSVSVHGKLSYASQEPWLFLATVKENILFGLPYDHKRYKETVRVCALEKDFQQFPNGDQTPIGDRGVSLSGGQKARINLARAVYREADIYLLDDPLSGVDVPVGSFLFQECFVNNLRGTTRIIVTHNLHYLKQADYIIVLNNGKIENKGKFDDLVNSGADIIECLKTNSKTNIEDDDTIFIPTNSIRDISRRISIASSLKSEYEEEDSPIQDDEVEEKYSGTIPWDVYKKYWTAGKGLCFWLIVFGTILLSHIVASSSDYWVTFWTNELVLDPALSAEMANDSIPTSEFITDGVERLIHYNFYPNESLVNNSLSQPHRHVQGLSSLLRKIIGPISLMGYIHVYSGLILLCVCLSILSCILFHNACMNSSKGLHNEMLKTILKAPMCFFDTNPSGRILNRFSKDLGVVDELLPKDMLEAVQVTMILASALLMVVITNAWFLCPIFAFSIVVMFIVVIYLRTAQDIKRLEGIARSPVFSHTCATIKGISTIRSANSQAQLSLEFDSLQDIHTSSWYQFLSSRTTFGFWLDIIGAAFIACVTFSFIYLKNGESLSGDIGLAISQLMKLSTALQFGVRQLTEVLSHFTGCERIIQYTLLTTETGLEKSNEFPKHWPSAGSIRFRNVSLNYNNRHKPVLENFSLHVESGWKVGIIGRTGAGKSSLIAAIFQLAKVHGIITIDDVDIETLSLRGLRSKISIIPQEPILFSETIRYNLDPYGIHNDFELWDALESVYLKDLIPTLDYQVQERGCNFSLGQRQLICLARAILKNNKVLVLDEVTANMDSQTDKFIQQIIREKFSHCTILAIAHRLNTIIDADRVLAMDGGKCVEFKHPFVLLQDPNSFFSLMVNETGEEMCNHLRILAKEAYIEHQRRKTMKKIRQN